MQRRKKALRWTIGLFFAILLVLTFLSNTIQGLSLPKVSVDKPETGGLELTVSGEGFLQPAYTAPLYTKGDWTVVKILKSKNDRVKRGDPLLTFDTSSTQRTLEDEQARYDQQELQLAKLADQLKTMLWNDDTAGIDNQKRDIEAKRLDLQMQKRKIDDLKQQIADGGTLTSPVDGVVTAINVSEGVTAGRGQPVVEVADDSSGYQFSVVADSNDASALRIGDKVSIQVEETPRRTIEGKISAIEDAVSDAKGASGESGAEETNKKITFDVKEAKLQPGLKASVSITSSSHSFGMQIPKSALHQDNSGYYIFTVKEKDGPLGSAYYVSKTYLRIQDENKDTVVTDGMMPNEQFVTASSEPLSDGDRVRY
ncbi:efflux RND transporter periplasmic adaptor subunit [Cohnella sp. REN36]|uniref:efflux RND transporter periplasmic adaptor subunit n=1 Tax=Cohnella sp. REN36 TaxID=2887347 RepID=UPI001D134E34|nr:efflux RND transporter periplasmic adaptor subunit [Cohnella sp. REN36]MCC3375199.1 efflux RND transporter periplasmic adaptor subunit [Cohnella sp. REN36]